MLELYKIEMQKLWKQKLHKLCIFLSLICIIYLGVTTYQRYLSIYGLRDEGLLKDGKIYTGFSAIHEIDKTHHERYMDVRSFDVKTYEDQERQFAQQLSILADARVIDEKEMCNRYGVDWKRLYEACQNQTLTYAEFQPEIQIYDQREIVPLQDFILYYTKESELPLHSFLKLERPQIANQWIDREAYLLTKEKVDTFLSMRKEDSLVLTYDAPKIMLPDITRAYSEEEMQYINERFLSIDTLFDASGGYAYFQCGSESLQATFIIALMLLGILLSGVFNQEYSTGVDQIMHPALQGSGKQAIAKLLTGMSVTAVLCFLTILCVWGVPYLMIGFYSLEQPILEFPITMRENMMLFLLLFNVSCLFYGSMMLLISSYTKSRFIALFLILTMILATYFLGYLFLDQSLVHLLPGSFIIPPFDYEIVSVFGSIVLRGYVVCAGWGLVSIGLLYFAYRHYQQKEIQNA